MNKRHLLLFAFIVAMLAHGIESFGFSKNPEDPFAPEFVQNVQDTIPLNDRYDDFLNNPTQNPFDLNDPGIINKNVEYDPVTGQYIITETIGEDGGYFRPPTYMTFEEYMEYQARQQEREYFRELAGVSDGRRGLSGRPDPIAKVDVKSSLVDRLFGGTEVDIQPQGSIDLTFGWEFSKTQNPAYTLRQQRTGGFDFDMAIQMSVQGSIGEKLKLSTNYNTQATFNFDNTMKLDYSTDAFSEDDIIKKIEAGNVSLPIRGKLIQGSQSLFGLKTELQFGRLWLTAVASQQKSERESITLEGGSQFQTFEVRADEYDENRHFFLTHYNRDNFEENLKELPQINTLFKVANLEVWVTDTRNQTENIRDIVAIADLGEPKRFTNTTFQPYSSPVYRDQNGQALPDNNANPIYAALVANKRTRFTNQVVNALKSPPFGFQQSRDFEKVTARKLSPTEYTFNPELGMISLNINVQPDQVVAASFEYFYGDSTYRVGEISQQIGVAQDTVTQNVIFVKLLKGTTQRVDLPTWDLMMKNVYSIGAYRVTQEDFKLDILYDDPGEGKKRFLPESNLAGQPLISVFNLDNLNTQLDPIPDGVFDFVPGVTINPQNGRIMFPVLEPFGSGLAREFDNPADSIKFTFKELYTQTITDARELAEKNRFTIEGSYKTSVSSEIALGAFNIPQNSVIVYAGGRRLEEGIHYEVDYNVGRVRILDDALLNSGAPIRIEFEDNALFGFQTKTVLGLRADYKFNENLTVGGTYLHLFERPYTQKVNIGDDPINNRIFGLDVNYSKEAPWLTKAVDAIPLIQTKAPSSITFSAETAFLKPGHAKAIVENGDQKGNQDKGGVLYIDDFEGSVSSIDLRTPQGSQNGWVLASVPQNDGQNNNPMFPESEFVDTTLSGVNRALVNWYRLDPSAGGNPNDPYQVTVDQEEVFPNYTPTNNFGRNFIPILDVRYCPDQRGPYNFDPPGGTPWSAGLAQDGSLNDPGSRWGGIMKSLTTNDFQAANIEFLEFWMMSPYLNPDDGGATGNPDAVNGKMNGDIYIEFGNISEDILRDSRKFFENGLPGPNTTGRRVARTGWGRVPLSLQVTNSFDIDQANREAQDVGLDGLKDEDERKHFKWFLDQLPGNLTQAALDEIMNDPSNDDFVHFRDPRFDNTATVYDRYARFYGTEGNTPNQSSNSGLSTASSTQPDTEDLDRDRTLNETESYFQYRVPLEYDGDRGIADNPYITESITAVENGVTRIWYRFRVPLMDRAENDPDFKRVGGIQDFRSIRFMRMYFKGFEKKIHFRFATLELVRNQWRRYRRDLDLTCLDVEGGIEGSNTVFDVDAVNIEENSNRTPFPYILPPGISREQALGVNLNALQNEQSLSLKACELPPGGAKAIYKLSRLDLRLNNRLKMFVHAEETECSGGSRDELKDGDVYMFIRLGSDFKSNYYEYAIPLEISRDETLPVNDENYPREVWRRANDVDIDLKWLKELKKLRNNSDDASLGVRFEATIDDLNITKINNPGAKFAIKGNPNLGEVKGIMIGLYNPAEDGICGRGEAKSVEIWINELRAFGLDERGGAAATAQLDMTLADFGSVTATGRVSSIGFGALDQQLAERSREEIQQFDIATSLQLGKFFGDRSGIKVPFYFQWSEELSTPEYDPYDLDIRLKEKLDNPDLTAQEKKEIKKQAQTATSIKSVSFTNVRKERTNTEKPPMPWDVSNFSFTYAYEQTESRDPLIENDQLTRKRGAIDYAYSRKVKYIEPFKKVIKNDKYLKLISEINFNPLPNSFSFSTELDRKFNKTKYRFSGDNPLFNTYYNKQFLWNRSYDLQWDLMRNLKIQFFADNYGLIDEPDEKELIRRNQLPVNDPLYVADVDGYRKDSIWTGIKDFGRTKRYNHNLTVNYTLPFDKIPFLEFINVRATYQATYGWEAASQTPLALARGNIIQNSQNRQINGDLDFSKLYNKSKYLKKINSKPRPSRLNRGRGRNQNNRNNQNQNGDDKKKKDRTPSKLERAIVRPLLLVRKLKATYSESFSTVIPGYTPQSRLLGMNNFESPGWAFVAGIQPNIKQSDYYTPDDWLFKNRSWITPDDRFNGSTTQSYSQDVQGKLTLEPVTDFKIDFEINRQFSESHEEVFGINLDENPPAGRDYVHRNIRDYGRFTMTYSALSTLFNDDLDGLFAQFDQNRKTISKRLGTGPHEDEGQAAEGYAKGYGRKHQDVLIPAFLAAYTGKDAATMEVSPEYLDNVLLKSIPHLNWRLTYNGLSKLPMFKDVFRSVSLQHSYKSTLTINSYNTALDYDPEFPTKQTLEFDYISRFRVPDISIQEQFSPLVGLKMDMKNGMSFNADYKTGRTLDMSFTDDRLTESKSKDMTIGFGYRLTDVQFGFLAGKKKKRKNARGNQNQQPGQNQRGGRGGAGGNAGDLDINFDFSIRDDISVNRYFTTDNADATAEPTRGNRTISILPAAEYRISRQLSLRFFFDYRRTLPKTSNSFPTTNINSGVTVRFQLN
ncbi:MAG: cell surface protein SprA [Bacteroidetes bacterium]|nr:MAG: cell surface protein SprA [Bacteroidota bacterium]